MNYELHLPPNYSPPPLPLRNQWLKALRSGEHKQGRCCLVNYLGGKCCLGVLSHIQGRLRNGCDGTVFARCDILSKDNPLFNTLEDNGRFPHGVKVIDKELGIDLKELDRCNDRGMTFNQIADIIEKVWSEPAPHPSQAFTIWTE